MAINFVPTFTTYYPTRYHSVSTFVTLANTSTTYYYRQTNGTKGSTTSLAAVPAGAVILHIV